MDFNQKISCLEEGTIVLTSTERVARFVRMQVAATQAASGKKAWFNKGVIKTVTSWIEQTWLDLMPDEQLLFPVQELAVTKTITDGSGLLPDTIISSTSTARKVNQAFTLTKKYGIHMDRDLFLFKPEFEVYFQWHQMIEQHCKQKGWVFRAHLPELLLSAIQNGEVAIPKKILIVGLLQLNPAEEAIFNALEAGGCVVEHADHAFDPVSPKLLRPHTQQQEFAAVAKWVSESLIPYADEPLAAPTMAIVVPDVRKYSAPLIDALALHAAPTAFLPGEGKLETKTLWDISSGASLGARPIVRCAMDVLSITHDQADSEVFSRVLRSRWVFAPENEVANRAILDVWMRENLGLSMGGKDFLRAIGASKKAAVPYFRERFGEVMARRAVDDSRLPSEWAAEFSEVLSIMGWPGLGDLDSANFQTLKAWDEALVLFRTLDGQLGAINYKRSYMWLREILDTLQFQPRIAHQAPVAIMSYEEAIGLRWEKVWICGASSNALPAPATPSPFIPTPLQSAAGFPESTGDLSLERAKLVVDALLRLGEEVVVSCPEVADRGFPLGQCELFGVWPAAADDQAGRGAFVDNLVGTLDRSSFVLESAPPVSDMEKTTLKGGVAIFKDYAEAPFFSFAKHRLGATQFPEPLIGLDPRIQGTMVHLVLELFWSEVRSSWNLQSMSTAELNDKIHEKVNAAADQLLNKLIWRYGSRIIQLEQLRLRSLVQDWMELEKLRELEFEVIGFEVKHDIDVWGVPVTVTVDRHDRVFLDKDRVKFRELVLDYKSGATLRFKGLNAETLNEPQLPIYATRIDFVAQSGKPLDGIALAQVNTASLGFHTRSNFTASLSPRSPRNSDVDNELAWEAQTQAWDRALQGMAAGFLGGEANVEAGAFPIGYEFIAPLTR
jgi:ATP-dependent helicase/nuclease subunit B